MNNTLRSFPLVLAFLSFLLFAISGVFLIYHYNENGVITRKGILLSAMSSMLSGASLVLMVVLVDDTLLTGAVFLFCLLSFSVIIYALYHLFFLNFYNRRQQRDRNREIDEYLKDNFKKN